MKKGNSKLGFIAMVAGLLSNINSDESSQKQKAIRKARYQPARQIIPRGCKMYYFDENFDIYTSPVPNVIYQCIALNEKNAIRKITRYHDQRQREIVRNSQPGDSISLTVMTSPMVKSK